MCSGVDDARYQYHTRVSTKIPQEIDSHGRGLVWCLYLVTWRKSAEWGRIGRDASPDPLGPRETQS